MEQEFLNVCKRGNIQRIKELINHIDPSFEDNISIINAAEAGRLEVVALLLQDPRVDPSARNDYAIKRAVARGHIEIVKLLLADPRVNADFCIRLAAVWGHFELVKMLMYDYGLDPASPYGPSALAGASTKGHIKVVELLLSDPRVKPTDHVIRLATKYKHTEIVELLTRHQYELDNAKYHKLVNKCQD